MKRQSTVLNLTPEPFQGIGDNPGMVKSQAVVFRYLIFNKRAFFCFGHGFLNDRRKAGAVLG